MIKIINFIVVSIATLFLVSCESMPDNFGFYQPITLRMTVPDGPPEYKAGWHDGCRSGLSIQRFANSAVYQDGKGVYFGNGVYQHDGIFQMGWSHGWFSCVIHTGVNDGGVGFMKNGPLQK